IPPPAADEQLCRRPVRNLGYVLSARHCLVSPSSRKPQVSGNRSLHASNRATERRVHWPGAVRRGGYGRDERRPGSLIEAKTESEPVRSDVVLTPHSGASPKVLPISVLSRWNDSTTERNRP